METLSKSLYSVVSQAVDEFAQVVADKFDVSKDEVLDLWNSKVAVELSVSASKKEDKKPAPRTRATKTESKDESSVTCCYEFKKGKNAGSTCTAKVWSAESKYCRKHKAQEEKEETTSKPEKKPASKATKTKKADVKEKESAVVKKLSEGKTNNVLKKNSFGNYEHIETGFVFDKVTKEVYGKQIGDEVEPLTTEDIDECRKLSFKYRLPETLKSKNEDDEDDEELDDEEEVEDEELDDEEEVEDEEN